MAYLYGDSTESGLEINYIEFLRAALDFSVAILAAEDRVRQSRSSGDNMQQAAEAELSLLHRLSGALAQALDENAPPDTSSPVGQCAAQVRQHAIDAVGKMAEQVRGQLNHELLGLSGQIQKERAANLVALQTLLANHDLPGTTNHISVRLNGGRYAANLSARCDLDLEWNMELQIPQGSAFAAPLKVEKLVSSLDIRVPEKSGLVRKSMKLRTQRLASQYVTEFLVSDGGISIKLRATADPADTGYDLIISNKAPRVRLTRVGKNGEAGQPFEPLEEDCARLDGLRKALQDAVNALRSSPGVLVDAFLDGQSLAQHEDPSMLVRRLIEHMAPIVRAIAEHSLSRDELVLKQVVGNHRREEIFASKAELLAQLDPVSPEYRGIFAPLDLGRLTPPPGVPITVPTAGPPGPPGPPPGAPGASAQSAANKQSVPRVESPFAVEDDSPTRPGSQAAPEPFSEESVTRVANTDDRDDTALVPNVPPPAENTLDVAAEDIKAE